MFGQDRLVPAGPMVGWGGDPRRLSDVISAWLQKEASLSVDDAHRRAGSDDPGARGPFYAPLFLRQHTVSTPPLVQQLKTQCKVSWNMKVFTKLRRAAAFIDERVFLWNYETGRDPLLYDASAVVTGMELCRPKPGVFAPHVHHLLVVTTFSSVELVAVHVKDPQMNEVVLQPLPEYKLTTGQIILSSIAAFDARDADTVPRVFLGGNDGCVYELVYTATSGWLSSKMHLQNISIVAGNVPLISGVVYKLRESMASFVEFGGVKDLQIDTARNFLYALDSRGFVSMWWLGPDGDATLRHFQCRVNAAVKGTRPASLHVVRKLRNTDHEILCVLMEDGSRHLFSASSSHEDKHRTLQPPRTAYGSDLGRCSLKMLPQLQIATAKAGPLSPSIPLDRLDASAIDDGCRSCVGQRCSVLIPKNHQASPKLICTASLDSDSSSGNIVSIVDLKPLIGQAASWRQGSVPTSGLNIFTVVEDEWFGGATQGPSSELISQVSRAPPRFLVVHSAGITVLTRLRPTDLLHIALLYPTARERAELGRAVPALGQDGVRQLDFDWLLSTYGKVEVSVMLLALICSGTCPGGPGGAQHDGGAARKPCGSPDEELIAHALSSPPSHDVVQRAQEQFTKLGLAGQAALFQFFVRASNRLWATSFVAPFWEQVWSSRLFSVFLAPLQGLAGFLQQLSLQGGADVQQVWNAGTDLVNPESAVHALISQCDSFSDFYEMLGNPGAPKPDHAALKALEVITRKGLLSVVQRTVEALTILRAVETLKPEDRTQVVSKIRFMELNRVVTGSAEEAESFADALMSELLKLPHAVSEVWPVWRTCTSFFDPAAVDFYEARQCVLSPQSVGNPGIIQRALARLERPEVAPCLLRAQVGSQGGGVQQPFRLEIICEDLCSAHNYLSAIQLATVAARCCDPEHRAEAFSASHLELAPGDPSLRGGDTGYFNARRVAYHVIINVLGVLCDGGVVEDTPPVRAKKAAAVGWALGAAAERYYESQRQGVARPILAGELFQSSDKLLHFHLYAWLVTRNGAGMWPSRADLSRIRPHRPVQQHQGAGDTLQEFLSAGHFGMILKQPLTPWSSQIVEQWKNLWDVWHIGLLGNLADYCEMNDEGVFACCVRLTLAHASSALLQDSCDFASHHQLLSSRIEILVKAEAACRGSSTQFGRQIEQWLQSQRPSAVAGVQLEMLRELPHEAWCPEVVVNEQLGLHAAQDKAELEHELLPAHRLYEMLHDSYDEAVPHLAIKLLRIMGIDRPELKHIFTSTSSIGPYTVQDFVGKVIERHRRLIKRDAAAAINSCFSKLQDAAGIDQGIIHHTPPPFLPLQLVLSGLEEMALQINDQRGLGVLPEGSLCDIRSSPASVVPQVVGRALNWPASRVLYDGYRLLWLNVERGQVLDMFPRFRGTQVEDVKVKRALVSRLVAVLGQLCLQWVERYDHPLPDDSYQQLSREYLVFADDVTQMSSMADNVPDTPANVRELIDTCKKRLERFVERVQCNQPSIPRRDW